MLLTALLSPRCVSISFPKRLLCFEKQLWLFLLSSDETSDLSVNTLKNQSGGFGGAASAREEDLQSKSQAGHQIWFRSLSACTQVLIGMFSWFQSTCHTVKSVFRVCATHSLITIIMTAEVKSKVKL